MDARDANVLAALQQAGSRLELPHPLRHYVYVSRKETAELVANKLSQGGFRVEVAPGALGGQWLILASHHAVPTPPEIARLRTLFESTASEVGGEYDGWEAGIVRA